MPSVRVKGRTYTTLDDIFSTEPRPLSPSPSPPATPATPAQSSSTRLVARFSLPLLRQQQTPPTPSLPPPTRPRAATSASRIHAHVTLRNSTPRQSQLIPPASLRPDSSVRASPLRNSHILASAPDLAPDHTQAELLIPEHAEPGLVESSLNLSHTEDDSEQANLSHHHDDVVEHLDAIDPQVGTFANLTNVANAIVIPPTSFYSRKPVIVLPSVRIRKPSEEDGEQFEDSLDRHVDDVLKRPSKWRRTFMGIWSFLKTPMGIITGIYGFLVVFWGAAIVFFLARFINFHNPNTQGFWIEVSSQVVNGLFTATSVGLIPARVLDTFRIYKIWRYKRRTMKLRAKAGLPQLFDVDDLPDPIYDPNYVHVLTDEEQHDLHRQQRKFQYSQTWYRAHGTETHRAFPISIALWICFLNDANSVFQLFLCGTMWGMNRFRRPPWTTATLIPCAFLCGIAAAVLIWRGGERTKRVEEVKERLRQALAEKKVVCDDQLKHSLSRNSKLEQPQATQNHLQVIDEKFEQPRTSPLASEVVVDEHMTVPQATEITKT